MNPIFKRPPPVYFLFPERFWIIHATPIHPVSLAVSIFPTKYLNVNIFGSPTIIVVSDSGLTVEAGGCWCGNLNIWKSFYVRQTETVLHNPDKSTQLKNGGFFYGLEAKIYSILQQRFGFRLSLHHYTEPEWGETKWANVFNQTFFLHFLWHCAIALYKCHLPKWEHFGAFSYKIHKNWIKL